MDQQETRTANRLSSQNLAVLIVDALVDAGLVEKQFFDTVVEVTTREIDVRKALGGY